MIAVALNPKRKTLSKAKVTPIPITHARSKSSIHTARPATTHGFVNKDLDSTPQRTSRYLGSTQKPNKSYLDHSTDYLNSTYGVHIFLASKNSISKTQGGANKTFDTTIQEIHVLNLSSKRKEEYEKSIGHQRRKSEFSGATSGPLFKFQEAVEKAEKTKEILIAQLVFVSFECFFFEAAKIKKLAAGTFDKTQGRIANAEG